MAKSTVYVVQKYIFAKKCILISFWISNIAYIIPSHFIILPLFYSSDTGFFQYHPGVKQFGSRSGPTFCRAWSGFKLFAKISRQQKSLQASKGLNTKQLVDTTFWLKPWLKLISFGSNFSHLAKVLATTNSEPG